MLEWMFFVFIILHTESYKIKIMEETQIQEQIQVREFIEYIKQNPKKINEFINSETNKKK